MRKYELIAPCHFGVESVLKKEITDLGYDVLSVEDGRITFYGDEEAIARANIGLRTAERILIQIGSFEAATYDELFEGTKALPWEEFIQKDGKFWVAKAASVKSKLFSPSDIQSIMKKAIVERLKEKYHVQWFDETGESYPIRVFIMKVLLMRSRTFFIITVRFFTIVRSFVLAVTIIISKLFMKCHIEEINI